MRPQPLSELNSVDVPSPPENYGVSYWASQASLVA